jgi:predicted kinase
MAESLSVPFYIVHTFCPDSLAKERLDSRALDPKGLSDGRWEIYQPQKEEFEAPDNGEAKVVRLDTSNTMRDNIRTVFEAMGIY